MHGQQNKILTILLCFIIPCSCILTPLNQRCFPTAWGPHVTQLCILSTECFDMLPAVSTRSGDHLPKYLNGSTFVMVMLFILCEVGTVYIFFLPRRNNPSGPKPPHFPGFTIALRHTTLGGTLLDEWSVRRRDLYLITHNTHKRQTSKSPAGFEPSIPASERWPLGWAT